MPTKEQLSDDLNQILDLDLGWEKMNKDDLELLLELAEEGGLLEQLVKHQAQEYGKEKVEQMVDDWYPGKYAAGTIL